MLIVPVSSFALGFRQMCHIVCVCWDCEYSHVVLNSSITRVRDCLLQGNEFPYHIFRKVCLSRSTYSNELIRL